MYAAKHQLKKTASLRRHVVAQWKRVFLQRYTRYHHWLLTLDHTADVIPVPSLLRPFLTTTVLPQRHYSTTLASTVPSPLASTYSHRHGVRYESSIRLPLTSRLALRLPSAVASESVAAEWQALEASLAVFRGSPGWYRQTVDLVMNSTAFQQLDLAARRSGVTSLELRVERQLQADRQKRRWSTSSTGSAGKQDSGLPAFLVSLQTTANGLGGDMMCLSRSQSPCLRRGLKEVVANSAEVLMSLRAGDAALPPQSTTPSLSDETPAAAVVASPRMPIVRDQSELLVPDVALMIAEMERLSRSKVVLDCVQEAHHEPRRRLEELLRGEMGDVEVHTKVTARLAGTAHVAVAQSHSFDQWTSPTSQSTPALGEGRVSVPSFQGPLPLIIAAVTRLHRAVCGSSTPSPLLAVRHPESPEGLRFLLFSWFGSSPHTKAFTIHPIVAASGVRGPSHHPQQRHYVYQGTPYEGIVRVQLFYDVLGCRLLFAESHHWELDRCLQHTQQLAVLLNAPRQDSPSHTATTAAGALVSRRSSRGIRSEQMAGKRQEALLGMVRTGAAGLPSPAFPTSLEELNGATTANPRALALRQQQQRRAGGRTRRRLLRYWLRRQPSELSALLAVLQGLGQVTLRWVESRAPASSGAAITGTAAVHFRLWSHAEVVARMPSSAAPEVMLLRCLSAPETAGSEASSQRHVPALHYRLSTTSTTGSGRGGDGSGEKACVPGLLPAFTLLCQRTLEGIYTAAPSLHEDLAPLSELLDAATEAQCCFPEGPRHARMPPYEPRFFTATNLLGEALQGVSSRYDASYSLVQQQPPSTPTSTASTSDTTCDASDLLVEGHTPSGAGTTAPSSSVPTTVFYATPHRSSSTSQAEHDVKPAPTPFTFRCVLSVRRIGGLQNTSSMVSDHHYGGDDQLDADASPSAFILAAGTGPSKRAAWKAAALVALRLNFPEVWAQLPAWQLLTSIRHDPCALSLLGSTAMGIDVKLSSSLQDKISGSTASTTGVFTPRVRQCVITAAVRDGEQQQQLAVATAPTRAMAFCAAMTELQDRYHRLRRATEAAAVSSSGKQPAFYGWSVTSQYSKSLLHSWAAFVVCQARSRCLHGTSSGSATWWTKVASSSAGAVSGRMRLSFIPAAAVSCRSSTYRSQLTSAVLRPYESTSTSDTTTGLLAVWCLQAISGSSHAPITIPLSVGAVAGTGRVATRLQHLWECCLDHLRGLQDGLTDNRHELVMALEVILRRLQVLREAYRLTPLRRAVLELEAVFGIPIEAVPLRYYAARDGETAAMAEAFELPQRQYEGSGVQLRMSLPRLPSPFPVPGDSLRLPWVVAEAEGREGVSSHVSSQRLVKQVEVFIQNSVLPFLKAEVERGGGRERERRELDDVK